MGRPASAWQRITLPALTRLFRTPKVLDEHVQLKGYPGQLRQVTVIDLGHEEPTILLTNNEKITCSALVTRYAQRMLIENGIAEAVQFFHLDALSSMVGLKVDFDLQITLDGQHVVPAPWPSASVENTASSQAKSVFRNLLKPLGQSRGITGGVRRGLTPLDKRAGTILTWSPPVLAHQPTTMPWFGNKKLIIQFALRSHLNHEYTPFVLSDLLCVEIEASSSHAMSPTFGRC